MLIATRSSTPRLLQTRDVGERALDRPFGERTDQIGRFRERDEFGGTHVAVCRVLPAHERLDAGCPAGTQVHLRLVVEVDAAVLDRRSQLAQHAEPANRVLIVVAIVVLERRAVALRDVHGDVRVAQQLFRVARVIGGHRDADAHADLDRDAARVDGQAQALDEPQRELVHGVAVVNVGEHHGELVAADPADQSAARELRREAARHLAQHLVSDIVAERVVHLFEPAEIEHQQRDAVPRHGLC